MDINWAEEKIWHVDFGMALIILLAVVYTWRTVTYHLESAPYNRTIPKWAQYYSLMYLGFAVLLVMNLGFCAMMFHSTNFFDPDTIVSTEISKITRPNVNVSQLVQDWRDEADLSESTFLKYFSMSLMLWISATFFTCFFHTFNYIKVMPARISDDVQRDRTIIILALPFVYGFMAFWSVAHCWQISAVSISLGGNFFHTVGEAIERLMLAYEANFAIADVYEAAALWTFAKITLEVLSSGIQRIESKVQRDMRAVSNNNDDISQSSTSMHDVSKHVTHLQQVQQDVNRVAQTLTMGGIRWFCVSCAISAICQLIPVQLYFWGSEQAENSFVKHYLDPVSASYLSGLLTGFGTIGSFSAIECLLVLEMEFGETHLTGFNTTRKFWSTKVLVSIVFMQQILLGVPPLANLSLTRKKLAHASFLCFECFIISIAHFKSWSCEERWYKGLVGFHQEERRKSSQALKAPLILE